VLYASAHSRGLFTESSYAYTMSQISSIRGFLATLRKNNLVNCATITSGVDAKDVTPVTGLKRVDQEHPNAAPSCTPTNFDA
jgi:hypothetical protein